MTHNILLMTSTFLQNLTSDFQNLLSDFLKTSWCVMQEFFQITFLKNYKFY